MRVTCVGVDGESAVENVAPVTIGVATGAEFVSLNLSTITWMYTLWFIEIVRMRSGIPGTSGWARCQWSPSSIECWPWIWWCPQLISGLPPCRLLRLRWSCVCQMSTRRKLSGQQRNEWIQDPLWGPSSFPGTTHDLPASVLRLIWRSNVEPKVGTHVPVFSCVLFLSLYRFW